MLIAAARVPDEIQRGVDTTLTLVITEDTTGATVTPTSGTVDVYAGSQQIITGAAVSAGASSTYTVAAASTDGRSLSSDYLVVWSMVVSGVTHQFQRAAYLVRRPYRHVVVQSDLTELHPDLASRETAATVDLDAYIRAADVMVRRELIKRGNRPDLVLDPWALADAHRYKALELIYRDDAHAVGDGRHAELAAHYAEAWDREWSTVVLTYDHDEDGTVDTDERRSGAPVILLTSRKRWYL